MNCKLCSQLSQPVFRAQVLSKYSVEYFSCTHCGFIQTEKAYWLSEAYQNDLVSLDVGYVTRNITLSQRIPTLINFLVKKKKRFLDYGGGFGLLVRMMRDRGFDFYRQDLYCKNEFAQKFDISDLEPKQRKFELLTAFEVFEHLDDPLKEIECMFSYSDSILFSTELQPRKLIKDVSDWWYFMPQSGQHIAFYSQKSLQLFAENAGLYFYTNNKNIHLLTKKRLLFNPIGLIMFFYDVTDTLLNKNFQRKDSLIKSDFELIKKSKQ